MAAEPYMMVKAYKDKVESIMGGMVETFNGNGLDLVQQMMDAIQVENRTDLPFVGGAVGTVGYDMIRDYEVLPDDNEDTIQTPDSHLLFVKEMVVYDHHFHRIHIICLDSDDEEGKSRSEERFAEIEKMIHGPLKIERHSEALDIEFTSNMTKDEYMTAVDKAKNTSTKGISSRWSCPSA